MKMIRNQRGAALLIMILVLVTASLAVLLKALSGRDPGRIREETTVRALSRAKELVIARAVTNQVVPGGLPFPDRRQDNNYDGNGDCVSSGFDPTIHLLGKWPHLDEQGCGAPVAAFGQPLRDGAGETLWYAVSRHLVKSAGGNFPVINSELLAQTSGWFTVVDRQGNQLTDRAAVVILAPGGVVQSQNRGGSAPTTDQFLESAVIGGVTYTNYAIESSDTGFITGPADDDLNDQLVYITIEDLMAAMEQRVAGEFRKLIADYRTACGLYPWPRLYLDPRSAPDFNSVADTLEGLLPVGTALPVGWGSGCAGDVTLPTWLVAHNWHHLSYYALASTAVQGGGACTSGVDCLTVNGWPPPNNDKEALTLLAGRELSGQNRASFSGLSDYFEGENATAGDRLFVFQAAGPSFNDRLEVVR